MCSANPRLVSLGLKQPLRSLPPTRGSIASRPDSLLKSSRLQIGGRRHLRRRILPVAVIDDGSAPIPTLFEDSDGAYGGEESNESHGGRSPYALSSEGEESDTDLLVYAPMDLELPRRKDRVDSPDAAVALTAHRFANLRYRPRKRRIRPGFMINMGLVAFSSSFLLFFDWFSWRIVRLPLEAFHLTQPFAIAAVLSACAGYLYVPIVDSLKIHQIIRKEGPTRHTSKKGTPTMGGLFFIPIGVSVARSIAGQNSIPIYGAAVVTLAFAAIGLLDDILSCIKRHNYGLPGWIKLLLQVAIGTCFSFWLDSTSITTPYNMKFLIPLPQPFGLVYLGKSYLLLTAFCFAAMGNGVNLTDGLDGLAGGVAALAFIGMSVAVLALCPGLAIFGAAMAGACIGFLVHNRYKASIFMGDTGSLALGGALAAMAACTGMFFPLFISSGIFVLEVLSVIIQVFSMKVTKKMCGASRRIFRMAPIHHHFELCGWREPFIVASAYAISCMLALVAGYVGLISA